MESKYCFNSYGSQLARILAIFFMMLCDAELMHGRIRRTLYGIAIADGLLDIGLLVAVGYSSKYRSAA
ncbi:MAG: hypothetical protein EOM64_02020 [Erysipelotrichia bacterium]|nr:hypothetical protein [Erysipelotrichia bacterium]